MAKYLRQSCDNTLATGDAQRFNVLFKAESLTLNTDEISKNTFFGALFYVLDFEGQ